ncbi:hypothetical protein BJ944DRAFT_259401 [Cunninghamella echinulata]|nr:hypothetical protein BJ944DRAFT_259401 [Cunninghamella echinulata]
MSLMLRLAVLVGLMVALAQAQMGPTITSPPSNTTVAPGQKLNIEYQYPNMGEGDYKINIDLWEDASAKQHIANLASNVQLPPINNTGTKLSSNISASYEVTLPKELNFTFYLTVNQVAQTKGMGALNASSFPLMLHSAAMTHLPQSLPLLLTIALAVLGFSLF